MNIKEVCDGISAIAALCAAGAWFRAARAPLPFISFPSYDEREAMGAAIEAYEGFVSGAGWNKWAAILAGVSALASFLGWVLP